MMSTADVPMKDAASTTTTTTTTTATSSSTPSEGTVVAAVKTTTATPTPMVIDEATPSPTTATTLVSNQHQQLPPELATLHESIIKSLQRDLNILSEPTSDRNSKRRALERIQRETIDRGKTGLAPVLATEILRDLLKPLLRCVSDPIEKCRELSIRILAGFTPLVHDLTVSLPYTLPVLSSRLSQPDIVEPAEELRLMLVSALVDLVNNAGITFSPGVEETVKILTRTLSDPFADVKKESCKLVIALAQHTPRNLAMSGATVAKALIPSLQHKHSAVRVIALQALQEALLVDASGLDDVSDVLRALSMDRNSAVREALYATVAALLMRLVDRYSLGYKVLPFMLAGLTDELPNLRDFCRGKLEEIGALYEKEWEDRLKDELDYTMGVGNINLNPDRPRVGLRHLARDNTQKVVNKLIEGMQDWNAEVRAKSAAILESFILYAEANITGYIGTLLPVLYKTLAGDEAHVLKNTMSVAEMLGRFVNPDLYIDLLLSHASSNSSGTTAFRIGCLRTLHRLLYGTPPERLVERRVTIAQALADKELVGNENMLLLAEVATVAFVLSGKVAASAAGTGGEIGAAPVGGEGYPLFVVLVSLSSVEGEDKIPGWTEVHAKTNEAFKLLSTAYGVPDSKQLFPMHFDMMLASLKESIPEWTKFSWELRVVDTLLTKAGSLVGERLLDVLPVFQVAADEKKDPEARIKVMQSLCKLLSTTPTPLNSFGKLPEVADQFAETVVVPAGTWKPGRKLLAVRTQAMTVMHLLLQTKVPLEGCVGCLRGGDIERMAQQDGSQFLPVLVGCFDEDDISTRITALKVMGLILDGCKDGVGKLNADNFKLIYPEMIKRLDDASDDVRVVACSSISSLVKAITTWQSQYSQQQTEQSGFVDASGKYIETRLDNVHWTAMVKGVAIHVDDSSLRIQDAGSAALLDVSLAAPRDVASEFLNESLKRFRNVHRIQDVLQRLQSS
ncbi:HEAT repeat-containing protein 2 [Blyttiomyces sp. JEL0837]|nr:HEAT repeat-containing protein 2 [Blyttiomyces sp. JEL0837]